MKAQFKHPAERNVARTCFALAPSHRTPGLRFVRCIFAVLAIPILTLPLHAQEDYAVRQVQFRGNHTFSGSKLQEQIAIYGTGGLKKNLLRKKPFRFSKSALGEDVETLTRFYQQEGFLHVQVAAELVHVDDAKKSLSIRFVTNEGAPVRVRGIAAKLALKSGQTSAKIDSIFLMAKQKLRLTKGTRFRDADVTADVTSLATAFVNSGYPYVTIEHALDLAIEANTVDITWKINSGPKCFFGPIQISGNQRITTEFIKKRVTFKEHDLYRQSAIEKTQQQIYVLGAFQIVTVKAILASDKTAIIPVQIEVREVPRLTARVGLGYGREDKLRAFIALRRIGMFGEARRLLLLVKHSGLEPYNIDLRWTQPAFFSHKTALVINPFLRKETEPGYTVSRNGIRTSLLHQISRWLNTSLTYLFEKVNQEGDNIDTLSDIGDIEDTLYNKSGIILGSTLNTALPLFDPHRGLFAALTWKIEGLFGNADFRYNRFIFEFRKYSMKSDAVIAYRLKIGSIRSFEDQGFVPVEDRFYAGGSTSVRGWARQELGPKDEAGVPIGGKSLLEGSVEFRFPLHSSLIGATFVDFGNIWQASRTYKLDDLAYAFGFGIGYKTPIGPLRIDIAWPVSEKDLGPQLHFTIGNSF